MEGMTKASQYTNARRPRKITPRQSPYLVVYPFVKLRSWYSLPQEDRQRAMNEHMQVGHEFETIVNKLGDRRSSEVWMRLIVEKPFGHGRDSAHKLNGILQAHFSENEVFRIDHYLGKETVRTLLWLRERDLGDLEPPVHRPHSDHGRSRSIEGAAPYEQAGAIRTSSRTTKPTVALTTQ
jgi:hypothetical protein